MQRRYLILIAAVVVIGGAFAVFEFTDLRGTTTGAATGVESGGCAATAPVVETPAELPDDVKVIERKLEVPAARLARPDSLEDEYVPERFVICLDPDAPVALAPAEDGRNELGIPPLDATIAKLAPRSLEPLLPDLATQGTKPIKFGIDRIFVLETAADTDVVLSSLYAEADVMWVEPDLEMQASAIPDDPYYGYQWHLQQLALPDVWERSDGTGVVVAVLDTGVSAGSDGYGNLLPGEDFVESDGDAADEYGHGSHVAGTIAQATDNGIGVSGVAPGASILPVRVLDANGSGYASNIAAGIVWAVDNGAQVINMSLGSFGPSSAIEVACDYAAEAGVLVVASAGNDGFTDHVSFPAAFDSVVAVGATDLNREITDYSNQGSEIELAAPGGDTTVDHNGDGLVDGVVQEAFYAPYGYGWNYYAFQGTSMAAPHVSGAAALVISGSSDAMTDVRGALTGTAMDLGDEGRDNVYGFGFVSPMAALDYTPEPPTAEVEIINLHAVLRGPGRALLRWRTEEPTSHVVTGDNGFTRNRENVSRVHREMVFGDPGTTVTFNVTSTRADGVSGTATIAVEFAEAPESS